MERTDDDAAVIRLVMELRGRGIADAGVLSAIERVPRPLFVADTFQALAYDDTALPIECGQTISQPYIVALMSEHLALGERHRVLEVGTGSGYQTAVLSHLCRMVYTIERFRTLAEDARRRFAALNLTNVIARIGDGSQGWAEQAPFDRIMVTAAARDVPAALIAQLRVGGVMVIPVGPELSVQTLWRITRSEAGYDKVAVAQVRFVPLVEGIEAIPQDRSQWRST